MGESTGGRKAECSTRTCLTPGNKGKRVRRGYSRKSADELEMKLAWGEIRGLDLLELGEGEDM